MRIEIIKTHPFSWDTGGEADEWYKYEISNRRIG